MNNNDFKATVSVEEIFLSMPFDKQNQLPLPKGRGLMNEQ